MKESSSSVMRVCCVSPLTHSVYQFAWAAITKYRGWGGLNTVWQLEVRDRVLVGLVLQRPLFSFGVFT